MNVTPAEWGILFLSLKVGVAAVLAMLPIAFALAWIMARVRFRGKLILDVLIHLPMFLPPVVTGWLLLIILGNSSPLGRWLQATLGISFVFHWTGAVLASAIMALPLMARTMRLSIESIDLRLENAAKTLGAGTMHIFLTINIPLCLPGILAGMALGFARAVGEFGATITFASNIPGETETLPLAIYDALQIPGAEHEVLTLSLLSIGLSVGALLLVDRLNPRHNRHGDADVV
ncbi:MAG: molybdate ABC transporter permease subunit [Alphaproteobacteria bacterium]|nr:molybdate ABC transporter permease subunit [Alphaproteobacteria bacterium]